MECLGSVCRVRALTPRICDRYVGLGADATETLLRETTTVLHHSPSNPDESREASALQLKAGVEQNRRRPRRIITERLDRRAGARM
jgi:hypothetical protein